MVDVVLETERLILRKPVMEDVEEMSKYNEREEFGRYLPFDETNKELTREFVKKIVEENSVPEILRYHFILIEKGTNKFLGDISLHIKDKNAHKANFGYGLNPTCWGKGYMTEALKVLIKFGFEELKLKKIWADVDPCNIGSWRVMEKCGMQREGLHRCDRFIRGKYCDSYYYSILDTDLV